jgi:4-hydroxybenzoyl-CoA reductase subunit alpha
MSLGKSMPKIDGLEKISGKAVFVDDMDRPGLLHAAFLRSPHAHANILSIDTTAAEAIEGVHAVLTGADLPVRYGVIPVAQDETALAVDKVRFIGEEVAVVAACDRQTAVRAAAAIEVRYETLPTVFTTQDALDPEKPLLHEGRRKASNVLRRVFQKYGDPESGFEEADVIIESDYFYPGSTHVPLETQGALAEVDGKGKLTLYSSTQIPHYLQRALARILEMPSKMVRVIKPHVGAGYGGKSDPFANEICAAALAIRTGRPVKCILNREEVFYTHRGRHPTEMTLKMGITKAGKITACDLRAVAPGGAYASFGVVTAYYFGVFMPLPYKLDNFQFEAKRLYTNHPPCGPKRGHGAIQPRFALELHMDKMAHAIGMDPADLRRLNTVEPNTETCNGLKITSVALKECIDRVKAASDYEAKKGHLPPNRGIGLATSAYMCGALHPIYQNEMPQSAVQVLVDRSGSVAIYAGTADIGQGSNHMLAALVGESLGVSPNVCTVLEADTALTPVDLGSYSSRVTFMAGNAAVDGAEKLALRIRTAVANKWECELDDVNLQNDTAQQVSNPDNHMPFEQAAILAESADGTLSAVGHYTPPKIGSRFRRQSVGPSPAYSFTAQVAEVEVDPETGITKIHKIWCAHDCGKAINPIIVEGQIEGSVYMGVGEAMTEVHDFHGQGLHRAPSILEYKIPTIHETPEIIALIVESNDPAGPHGAKEAGEGPQLATVPAIGIAIHDACGIWLNEAPFTPAKLLTAIERKARTDARLKTKKEG